MPELPDVEIYVECLEARILGAQLEGVRLASPFLLRSVTPPLSEANDRRVVGVRRLGKRLVFALQGDLFLVLHLMIAGRLRWHDAPAGAKARIAKARIPGRVGLAAFDFSSGTVVLTEAGSKRRASLYVVDGEEGLREHDRGGLEVLESDLTTFGDVLRSENHTLKRSLTDPRLFSGIGNAYSDEILHRAGLSPLKLTSRLTDDEVERLYDAVGETLTGWTQRLRKEVGDGFPVKVTAFRDGMAVHGRYREPCPVCGAPVQRIVYAGNQCNYCARCQNEDRLLADRALSRLLKKDWPKTLQELEEGKGD